MVIRLEVDATAESSSGLPVIIPAAYVYLIRGRQVLLQQRRNTGYLQGMWVAGAAGHIELGEAAVATAVREAAEEIGVLLRPTDLQPAHKSRDLRWFGLDDLPDDVPSSERVVLDGIARDDLSAFTSYGFGP